MGLTVTDLKFLSIPFISSFSGWSTNWLAIQASFYPIEFKGIRPIFGWQGIIPSKSGKMANIFISKSLLHMGNLGDVFSKFELGKTAEDFANSHAKELDQLVDEMLEDVSPGVWNNTPDIAKTALYKSIQKSVPDISKAIAEDLTKNIDYFIDIKKLMIEHLTKDKRLFVTMVKDLGKKEIDFAINSGMLFGFLFGIVQMLAWYHYPSPAILPFFGILVGTATNWIVLNMVFRPLYPFTICRKFTIGEREFGPYFVQGLFIRRQVEVASSFSEVVTEQLLTVSNIMTEVFEGRHKEEARGIIKKHLKPYIESHRVKLLIQSTQGFRGYMVIKKEIEDRCLEYFLESLKNLNSDELAAIKAQPFFVEKVKSLPPEDFQDMLRPAFQEDEWILIFLGGVLGGLVGLGQLVFMFS